MVAVLQDSATVVGFFAFHNVNGIAKPVGRFFNDMHNIVAAAGLQFDWRTLLKKCGVVAFDFHALVGDGSHLDSAMIHDRPQSFAANIGGDGPGFVKQLERDHRTMKKQDQKTRKMHRERGPLRFEFDCRDEAVLETAIGWKRDQYRRTDILDLFTPDWTRSLMRNLHQIEPNPIPPGSTAPNLPTGCAGPARGLVSALYAGDELVAAHVGMVDCRVLHYWFPVYNPVHAIYSPGTALFKKIAATAPRHNVQMIDMGYGEQPYKRKQTDSVTHVLSGCATHSRWIGLNRRICKTVRQAVKSTPMKSQFKRLLRSVQPNAGINKLR